MNDPRDQPDTSQPDTSQPEAASLAAFADLALRELTQRLEAKVVRGDATLQDYGALARCHAEWLRRSPGLL